MISDMISTLSSDVQFCRGVPFAEFLLAVAIMGTRSRSPRRRRSRSHRYRGPQPGDPSPQPRRIRPIPTKSSPPHVRPLAQQHVRPLQGLGARQPRQPGVPPPPPAPPPAHVQAKRELPEDYYEEQGAQGVQEEQGDPEERTHARTCLIFTAHCGNNRDRSLVSTTCAFACMCAITLACAYVNRSPTL